MSRHRNKYSGYQGKPDPKPKPQAAFKGSSVPPLPPLPVPEPDFIFYLLNQNAFLTNVLNQWAAMVANANAEENVKPEDVLAAVISRVVEYGIEHHGFFDEFGDISSLSKKEREVVLKANASKLAWNVTVKTCTIFGVDAEEIADQWLEKHEAAEAGQVSQDGVDWNVN